MESGYFLRSKVNANADTRAANELYDFNLSRTFEVEAHQTATEPLNCSNGPFSDERARPQAASCTTPGTRLQPKSVKIESSSKKVSLALCLPQKTFAEPSLDDVSLDVVSMKQLAPSY